MTMTHLIDAIPTRIQPISGTGWCITFGNDTDPESSAVYMLPNQLPYYVRFLLHRQAGKITGYEPISKRELTLDEVEHFEALVKKNNS
jgi:hypothetical protein